MKITNRLKSVVVLIISYMLTVLFTYAAFSKLANFESFAIQIGQSPLLSAFAGWISSVVLLTEVLISILLLVNRTRFFALIASFMLMTMFTTYIYIMLYHSAFLPCSCGGILEKMSWQEHFYFNLVFCILAGIAILFSGESTSNYKLHSLITYKLIFLSVSSIFSVCVVVFLYIRSEHIIHKENNFVRRYVPHLYQKSNHIDLKYSGFYFAGSTSDTLYLGNYNSPLSVLAVASDLKYAKPHQVHLDSYNLPFNAALVRIQYPYFFLTDGTIPCVFRGSMDTWRAKQLRINKTYFNSFEPMDSVTAAIRTRDALTKESLLGKLVFSDKKQKVQTNGTLLQKQIDGVFDSDGLLFFNKEEKSLIYTYYYRNQFIIADSTLKLVARGNTIDTTKWAGIKISTLQNGARKMAVPPLIVNKLGATFGSNLFVNSNLRGHFESLTLWKQSTVIDVYDIRKKTYIHSFYIHNIEDSKAHAMLVTEKYIYFLFGNALVSYTLDLSIKP